MSGGPIDPRLRALYDAERSSAAGIPEGAADRVLEGVSAKVAAGAATGAGVSSTALLTAGGLAAAVAVGIGVFATLDEASAPGPEQVSGHIAADAAVDVAIARDVGRSERPTQGVAAPSPPEPTDASDAATPPAPRATPRVPRAQTSNADEEWTLVQRARIALRSDRAAGALALLETHAASHPRGALIEERERLAIEALVALGRVDEARRRADEFHRRHPGSLHQAEIDRLLGR